ncbi:MAG: hypothetical protein WC370_02060 [Dehalococcoidales bacterium]|jgi:hypothetical protein
MHNQQWLLLAVMAVCGAAVIGSYVRGFHTHPGSAEKLWGGVTGGLRTFNFVTMILAVFGFFAFSYWLFFRLDPADIQIAGRFGFWLFDVIFLVILIPSALWMPLTIAYVDHPGPGLWVGVRLALALVGIGSLALLWAILAVSPREAGTAYWLAVAGAAAFCVQTAVLDMLVWPMLFRAR